MKDEEIFKVMEEIRRCITYLNIHPDNEIGSECNDLIDSLQEAYTILREKLISDDGE